MKVTKEEARQRVINFLGGEKEKNSVPHILTEVFTKFVNDGSLFLCETDITSVIQKYLGEIDGFPVRLVLQKDVAFINIMERGSNAVPKTDSYVSPIAIITMTKVALKAEALLKEEGICDFDSSVVQLIGRIMKEIVAIRKRASI